MIRHVRAIALLALAPALAACSGTRLLSAWTDPEVKEIRFEKVIVAVMSPDPGTRRAGEDRIVERIGPAIAVASYTVFPEGAVPQDKETAKAKIAEAGFDGAVVLRVVDSEQKVTYVPGTTAYSPYYGGFYGYWGYGWGATYSPGYMTTDTIVKLETLIYDVEKDKLVWASQSETTNPSGVVKLVDEVGDGVRAQMRRSGLIP